MAHFNFLRNSTVTHKSQAAKENVGKQRGIHYLEITHWSGKGGEGTNFLFLRNILQHLHPHKKKKKEYETLRVITCAALFLTTLVSHP